jgi:hypothetical protein
MYPRCAADKDGELLDVLVRRRTRPTGVARRLTRKLLRKKWIIPKLQISNKLDSCSAVR